MHNTRHDESTYWLLLQLLLRSKHRINAVSEKRGLTGMQAHALSLLSPTTPQAMSSLSTHLGCDASNVTGIVDRLEGGGLAERNDNPADRRVKSVMLTTAGSKLREEFYDDLNEIELAELAGLTTDEQAELRRLITKVLASYE